MPGDWPGSVLERTDVSQRVVTLRKRLLRADVAVSHLSPHDVNQPAVFDDHVDAAVRAFQQSRGLIVDGRVGAQTDKALTEAQYRLGDRTLIHANVHQLLQRGEDVSDLQRKLSHLGFYYGHLDGEYGPSTAAAVADLQMNVGLPATGNCDAALIAGIARVERTISTSTALSLRALERLQDAHAALAGTTIVLDAATRVHDEQHRLQSQFRSQERTVVYDIARRTATTLDRLGVEVILGHDPDPASALPNSVDPDGAERYGNATAVISLHCDWLPNAAAGGISAFYWGLHETAETRSPIGERLARLLQHEVTARTGAVDLGVHAKSWGNLRNASPAAVQLDVGYLSNPDDSARLADEQSRQTIADAIVIALQRLYLVDDDDPATGNLNVADVRALNGVAPSKSTATG